jgi:hypothetical protein
MRKLRKKEILAGLFLLLAFSGLIRVSQGGANPKPVSYSWKEVSFETSLFREWNNEPYTVNYSGTVDKNFTLYDGSANIQEQTQTRERREVHYISNYTYSSESRQKGYLDSKLTLSAYQVSVSLDKDLSLQWFALKQAVIDQTYYQESYATQYHYEEQAIQYVTSHFETINYTTGQTIAKWTSYQVVPKNINQTLEETSSDSTYFRQDHWEVCMPICLTMQLFKNSDGDKVAWAELFSEYILYRDLDGDLIYSAGESSDFQRNGFSIYSSNEMCGVIRPMAFHQESYQEITSLSNPQDTSNDSVEINHPDDVSVEEITDSIVFTPPELVDDVVSWEISYDQIPVFASIADEKNMNFYSSQYNCSMADATPQDFTFGFDYEIGSDQANLDFTMAISEVKDPTLGAALENLSLALPFYDYFLSTADIKEQDQVALTLPADKFSFGNDNKTVAEINLINPSKKNYTLMDYPVAGDNSEFVSIGGSLHHIITEEQAHNSNAGNPFLNLIYLLDDVVKNDPTFTVSGSLHHVHTVNYPTWNGKSLVHDPTLIVYFASSPSNVEPPSIPGFSVALQLLALIIIVSSIIWVKLRKNPNKDSQIHFF